MRGLTHEDFERLSLGDILRYVQLMNNRLEAIEEEIKKAKRDRTKNL